MSFKPKDYRPLLVITLAILAVWAWLGLHLIRSMLGQH